MVYITTFNNVTGARVLPKSNSIFYKLISGDDALNINGNVSMICKKPFLKDFNKFWNKPFESLSAEDLVYMFGYKDIPLYLLKEFEKWKKDLELYPDNLFDIFDVFVWEQRTSSWGALYPAEQDIAVEEFSPFNCRLLIETIMQTPNEILAKPDYPFFRELIRNMWSGAFGFPD